MTEQRNCTVNIVFSRGKGIVSRFIAWYTRNDWSHCDIQVGNKLIGALEGKGVNKRDISWNEKRYSVVLPLKVTKKQQERIFYYIKKQIGTKYDYTAIWGFLLKRNWQDGNRWFCSELIAHTLHYAGVSIIRHEDEFKISPRDLFLILENRNG